MTIILLREVLWESTAAEEAKRKGLVKKPGFGLYGPPDGPATHRSWFGKLRALKSGDATKGTTGASTGTTAGDSTRAGTDTRDTPSRRSVGTLRVSPTARVDAAVSRLREAMGADLRVGSTRRVLSALTGTYGRDTAPSIVPPGEGMRISEGYFKIRAAAVYDPRADVIEMRQEHALNESDPVSAWSSEDVENFSTHIHEALHSASRRIQMRGFYNNGINIAIEEGLTEYLASRITEGVVGPGRITDISYLREVDAIDLMATYGELDVDAAFRDETISSQFNTDTAEFEPQWTVRQTIQTAQERTIRTIMENTGLPGDVINRVLAKVAEQWKNDVISLTNPQFMVLMRFFAAMDPENPATVPLDPVDTEQRIMRVLG